MKASHIKLLSIIIILCLGKIIYSNTFFCSFHFDDEYFIIHNLAIRNIHDLFNIWKFYPCRFVPLFSLAFSYCFSGLNVLGYHIFNLAVHLASAILVWWLVLLTLSTPAMKEDKISQRADLIALFAGLVFVSHPVQTEAVTYIWQRTASMAALFYLASLCFYIKSRLLLCKGRFYYILSLIVAVLAMFTKENAVTLPLMVLLYEFTFLKTEKGFDWKYVSPFLVILFIIPLTMLFAESKKMPEIMGYHAGHSRISLGSFSVTELRVMVTYVRLAFLPFNQNFSYDYPVFKSVFEFPVLISAVFLMTVLYFTKRLFEKYRLVSFSIFWFFLTLLPESSFLPLEDVIFEHRLYLPLVGYSMFLVSSLYYLFGKKTFRMTGTVLAMLIICYSVLTYQRNNVWKDEFTLWDDTVKKSPHKAVGYINRGMAYSKRALLIRAMADFNQAIEIDPNITEAYNDRGYVYICFGDYIEAISDLNRALELNSNFAFAYYNRGVAYYHLGKYDKAWADVHKAKALGAVVNLKFINDLKKASF